jgi:hypothetical protein
MTQMAAEGRIIEGCRVGIPPEILSMMERPGMFVQPVNYDTICSFLDGYDMATKGGLLAGFHEWLVTKVGYGNNLAWPFLAEHILFPEAEDPHAERRAGEPKVMVDSLIEILREFFAEQDSHRGLHGIYLRYDRWLRAQDWYRPGHPGWMPIDD